MRQILSRFKKLATPERLATIIFYTLMLLAFVAIIVATLVSQSTDPKGEVEPPVIQYTIESPTTLDQSLFSEPMLFEHTYRELDDPEVIESTLSTLTKNCERLVLEINSGFYSEDAVGAMSNNLTDLEECIDSYKQDLDEIIFWDIRRDEFFESTYVWLYLKDQGYSDEVCAGILGNIMAECGGQTLDINPSLYNSREHGGGICGWLYYYSPSMQGATLEEQCKYLVHTIEKEFNVFGDLYYSGFTYEDFLSMEDPSEAAYAFAKVYERCSSNSYGIRRVNAEEAYEYFTNQEGITVS